MATDTAPAFESTFASELEGLYVPWEPQGVPEPTLVLLNRPLAARLGLESAWLDAHGAALLSGSESLPGARPLAQAYAGHQFGQFNPQLGDGRAVLLGELRDPEGQRFDLQLKGAGATPFSRGADGRAALDSALREYIVSEAMHALGIPSTRSLAVVTTGETVIRARPAPGAVLARIAASHLRIGTLEYVAARRDTERLALLVDYTLRRHYPERADAGNPAKELLDAVSVAQGELVARWMLVGFVHGVMNTDNVTLSGETIDYGPCAFIDAYDPDVVFSQIDAGGRYAFAKQPGIGGWNLARMAEALLELLAGDADEAVSLAQQSLELYDETFNTAWLGGMRSKLGLEGVDEGDGTLIHELLDWMRASGSDYTGTFRALATRLSQEAPDVEAGPPASWHERWRARLGQREPGDVAAAMNAVNPLYIVRNHKIEEALEGALNGDLAPVNALTDVLSRPFESQPGRETYAEPAPADFGPYRTHCNT